MVDVGTAILVQRKALKAYMPEKARLIQTKICNIVSCDKESYSGLTNYVCWKGFRATKLAKLLI